MLVLALAGVMLAREVPVLLGEVGNEVVRISIAIATILRTTTALVVHEVVVKSRESVDDQCQLIVPKCLHLLHYNRHQRRQGKGDL